METNAKVRNTTFINILESGETVFISRNKNQFGMKTKVKQLTFPWATAFSHRELNDRIETMGRFDRETLRESSEIKTAWKKRRK